MKVCSLLQPCLTTLRQCGIAQQRPVPPLTCLVAGLLQEPDTNCSSVQHRDRSHGGLNGERRVRGAREGQGQRFLHVAAVDLAEFLVA